MAMKLKESPQQVGLFQLRQYLLQEQRILCLVKVKVNFRGIIF